MKYTISEMASLLGVTTHMLRHYEKIGIIAPEVNKENGYRYYTVLDTRRFNLSRLLFSCGIPLEQCAELMGNEPLEEADALIAERQTALALEARRIQYAIDYLQDYREALPMIEADVGKMRIEHKPDMWRLMLSHVEKARSDKALQAEKQRWMACFPAVRWVSRIPYEVMKQFSSGPIEYDFGLMCVAEQGRALGLKLTSNVERVPGGDYVTMLHRKADRGPFTWEDIKPLTDFLAQNGLTFFGDTFSHIKASVKINGEPVNYHTLLVQVFTERG